MIKATWRADFFDNRDGVKPNRSKLITAETENEAAEKAAALMENAMRVDVIRTVTTR